MGLQDVTFVKNRKNIPNTFSWSALSLFGCGNSSSALHVRIFPSQGQSPLWFLVGKDVTQGNYERIRPLEESGTLLSNTFSVKFGLPGIGSFFITKKHTHNVFPSKLPTWSVTSWSLSRWIFPLLRNSMQKILNGVIIFFHRPLFKPKLGWLSIPGKFEKKSKEFS